MLCIPAKKSGSVKEPRRNLSRGGSACWSGAGTARPCEPEAPCVSAGVQVDDVVLLGKTELTVMLVVSCLHIECSFHWHPGDQALV